MTDEILSSPDPKSSKGFSGMQVIGMVIASMCIAIFATTFAIKLFLFPAPFKPVVLSDREEKQLATKLEMFDNFDSQPEPSKSDYDKNGTLKPEQYSEEGASRKIGFSERELNSIIAKNTDLADKLAIDLGANMVSLKLLIPLDPDFPMIGGKTLKLKAGAELAYKQGRPVVKLRGVSLMGVPMPNAWLGGMKNIDLVQEFGADEGFWKTFSDGVDSISVEEGSLKIQLKE